MIPDRNRRCPTRRGVLSALGGGPLLAAGTVGTAADTADPVVIAVRTYATDRSGWNDAAVAAHRAVDRAIESLARFADRRLDRPVKVDVKRGPSAPRDALDYHRQDGLLASLGDWLDDTDAPEGPICHLLLADAPLATVIGYGGSHGTVATGRFGGRAVANVGATETFDDRSVTRGMAIHEALHTLVGSQDARAVNGSDCEHDLGAVARLRYGDVVVTPFATAYAAPEGGTETRFHGSGCSNLDSFSRYDRVLPADEVRWHHTTTLSSATKRAVTRFVSRTQ
jgi:hypothetical protein